MSTLIGGSLRLCSGQAEPPCASPRLHQSHDDPPHKESSPGPTQGCSCRSSPEHGFAFGDGDVAVNRRVLESLDEAARLRPSDFEPIDFGSLADSKDHARVMRGEIAARAYFEAMPL